jgi:hypothetical protein
MEEGPVKVGTLVGVVRGLGGNIPSSVEDWWGRIGLSDYDSDRIATRLEAAVLIDAAFDPFGMFEVDYNGNIRMW